MSYIPSTVIRDIAQRIKTILDLIARPLWTNQTNGRHMVDYEFVSDLTNWYIVQ